MVTFGYRHRHIARFAVHQGKELFEFKDGILVIKNVGDEPDSSVEDRNAAFLKAWEGMEMRDRNAIIKLEVVENEHQITEDDLIKSRAIRGAVSTGDIRHPVASQNAGSGGAAQQAEVPAPSLGLRVTPSVAPAAAAT